MAYVSTTYEQAGTVVFVEDTVRFPEAMRFIFTPDNEIEGTFERDALALYPYILRAQLSYGRAAEILGVSRWSLIEWYASQGFKSLEITEADLRDDLNVLQEVGIL